MSVYPTTEERAAKKVADALRFPAARLPGIGCDIRMDQGSRRVEVCFHGNLGNGTKGETRTILTEDLLQFKELIIGLISRYNAAVEQANEQAVPKMTEVGRI